MQFSNLDTIKRLERLVLHLESTLSMRGMSESPDKFISEADFEVLSIAALTKSPQFVEWLIRLMKLTGNSKLGPKVMSTLVAMGEPVVDDLIFLLDTEHGPRAAMALAEIGSERAMDTIFERANYFSDYMPAALKICRNVRNDKGIKFLIDTLVANKPYGFPKSLMKKDENTVRIRTSNFMMKALKDITGESYKDAEGWEKWWGERGRE
ncbi:MAG: hypothetical protein NTY09_02235 [bacterium]|nr:hypothetical protein [bacterium]